MFRIKQILLFSLFILCMILASCTLPGDNSVSDSFTVSSWNVDNVFDSKDDGTEYSEYTTDGNWTNSLYQLRLSDINTVFGYSHLKDSSVVILNEVENSNVVQDILNLSNLKKAKLCYYAAAGEDNGAIKTAVVSKYPVEDVKTHYVEGSRPILEVKLGTEKPVTVLAVHAKSKRDGEETAQTRLKLGKTLEDVYSQIKEEDPLTLIILAGDFNEDWTENNMMMDVDSVYSGITDAPVLVTRSRNTPWYCFWLDDRIVKDAPGSYCYNGNWSCFDNILLSDASNLENAGVATNGILSRSDGTPNTWVRSSASGVSDHFPVWVTISLL